MYLNDATEEADAEAEGRKSGRWVAGGKPYLMENQNKTHKRMAFPLAKHRGVINIVFGNVAPSVLILIFSGLLRVCSLYVTKSYVSSFL